MYNFFVFTTCIAQLHMFQKYAIDLTKQIGIKGPHTAKKLGKQSSYSTFIIFNF
jgi:hypothetical protein